MIRRKVTDPSKMKVKRMCPSALLSAEQFADRKFDFPEGGRWTELHAGEVVTLSPPDELHGNVVLNFTKALATHAQQVQDGYACFELGLIVARAPDTVCCPAISYFQSGERFAELENLVTETLPALVVEIASSNDRRRNMAARIENYLNWGVSHVWLVDTDSQEIHLFQPGISPIILSRDEVLHGGTVLSQFRSRVEDLFAKPAWY